MILKPSYVRVDGKLSSNVAATSFERYTLGCPRASTAHVCAVVEGAAASGMSALSRPLTSPTLIGTAQNYVMVVQLEGTAMPFSIQA